MPSVRQIEAIVHSHSRATIREMDARGDQLRRAGAVPKSTGRTPPKATARHAAAVLIGYYGATKATHAAEAFDAFAELPEATDMDKAIAAASERMRMLKARRNFDGLRPGPDQAQIGQNFRASLAEILAKPSLAAACTEIWICRDQPFAEIRHRDGPAKYIRFYSSGDTEIGDDGWPLNGSGFHRIPGVLIRDIAAALAEPGK